TDGGDAEDVADDRVRCRATAVAEYLFLIGEFDDVVNREEITRVIAFLDKRHFLGDLLAELCRYAIGITLRQMFFDQMRELLLRRTVRGHGLGGIFVSELVEREAAVAHQLQRARDGIGPVAE